MKLQKPSYIKYALSWFLFIIVWLFSQLPYRVLIYFGKGLGLLLKFFMVSRKKVVKTNLKMCFPELSELELNNLSKQHLSEVGMMVSQTLLSFFGRTKALEKNCIINGAQHLEKCIQNKQGVLLVAGHFTALDLGGRLLFKRYPVAGMYRPHKHPLLEYLVTKSRLKYATKMFKRDELKSIIKHLKSGKVMWYAPDQDYRRGSSVFVPFFNTQASTITATHQMARLSKCKIIYFHVKRNDSKPYYTLTLSPVLENFPSKDAVADTARINQGIEEMVKVNPAEYLWVHKRFKTVPEGEKNPY